MRDLQYYAKECINDMKALGIAVPYIKEFKVNTRAKSRYGQCQKIDGTYSIDINVDLLDEECPLGALKETLYHEIIHTLPKCFNHGYEFKRYAGIVNKAYGVNVTRCSTQEEKYGVTYAKKVEAKSIANKISRRYQLYCPNCETIVAERIGQRAPKWYAHANRYSCKHCRCSSLEKIIAF